jgi:hypothetical protein
MSRCGYWSRRKSDARGLKRYFQCICYQFSNLDLPVQREKLRRLITTPWYPQDQHLASEPPPLPYQTTASVTLAVL